MGLVTLSLFNLGIAFFVFCGSSYNGLEGLAYCSTVQSNLKSNCQDVLEEVKSSQNIFLRDYAE